MTARVQINQQLDRVVREAQDPWSRVYNNRLAVLSRASKVQALLDDEPGVPLAGACLDWLNDDTVTARGAWQARGCDGWAALLNQQFRGMAADLDGYWPAGAEIWHALADQVSRGETTAAEVLPDAQDVADAAAIGASVVGGVVVLYAVGAAVLLYLWAE
jgi:hypothetical protein